MIVLDSNVLSEPLRVEPEQSVLEWLRRLDERPAITAVSVGELLEGVARLPEGRRRDGLAADIARLLDAHRGVVLAYDERAAVEYARVVAERRRQGRPISVEDAMIASICLVAGARLATRNTADFDGLGLEVVNPWTAV